MLILALAVSVAINAALCIAGNGLPYVGDNNESFSSLWHAYNLYKFPLDKSFGLADESFNYDAPAHPVVHTHQGNFPRLFAFILYLLGADTIQRQIVATTFIVAPATCLLMFLVLTRLANPLFAGIACVVLSTDYLLFAQWEVVTYRVWHGFFLFATLLGCFGITGPRWKTFAPFVFAVWASLFYFELVFATFVASLCMLFAAALHWRTPRIVLRTAIVCGAGAALALTTLTLQNVGYFGWEELKADIGLTLFARNSGLSRQEILQNLRAFYEHSNVIFWYNFFDASPYRSLIGILKSFFAFDLDIFTPSITIVAAPLFFTWAWLAAERPINNAGTRLARLVPEPLRRFARPGESFGPLAVLLLFWGAWHVVCNHLVSTNVMTGQRLDVGWIIHGNRRLTLLVFVLALIPAVVTALMFHSTGRAGGGRSVAPAILVLLATAAFAHLAVGLRNIGLDGIFRHLADRDLPPKAITLCALASCLVAMAALRGGRSWLYGGKDRADLSGVLTYLICACTAYLIVFLLSPGYILTGYAFRQAPFTIFISTIFVSIALYMALHCVAAASRDARRWPSLGHWRRSTAIGILLASIALTAFLIGRWTWVQASYARIFPPNHYAFLPMLSKAPYRGGSAVVNNYGAPVAAFTGKWAYDDPRIWLGRVHLGEDGYIVERDNRYLWFADRRTNDEYTWPKYFICMRPQTLELLSTLLSRESSVQREDDCRNLPILRQTVGGDASTGSATAPLAQLVAIDDSPRARRLDFSFWSIASLNWHFPPYLRRLPDRGGERRRVELAIDPDPESVLVRPIAEAAMQDPSTPLDRLILRFYRLGAEPDCDAAGADAPVLLDETADGTQPLPSPLPRGRFRFSVTPHAGKLKGREEFSPPFTLDGMRVERCGPAFADEKAPLTPHAWRINYDEVAFAWSPPQGASNVQLEESRNGRDFILVADEDAPSGQLTVGLPLDQPSPIFRLRACNRFGDCTLASSSFGVEEAVQEAPRTAPTGISGHLGPEAGTLHLTWQAVPFAMHYHLEIISGDYRHVYDLPASRGSFDSVHLPLDSQAVVVLRGCNPGGCGPMGAAIIH